MIAKRFVEIADNTKIRGSSLDSLRSIRLAARRVFLRASIKQYTQPLFV